MTCIFVNFISLCVRSGARTDNIFLDASPISGILEGEYTEFLMINPRKQDASGDYFWESPNQQQVASQ